MIRHATVLSVLIVSSVWAQPKPGTKPDYAAPAEILKKLPIEKHPPKDAKEWERLSLEVANTWAKENIVERTVAVELEFRQSTKLSDGRIRLDFHPILKGKPGSYEPIAKVGRLGLMFVQVAGHAPVEQTEALSKVLVAGKRYRVQGSVDLCEFQSWRSDAKGVIGTSLTIHLKDCEFTKK